MDKIIGIYCLTSPSGKSYIGQSTDINTRLHQYKLLKCKSQPKIYRAILKYGFDKFKITILEECNRDELNEAEYFYANYLDTVRNGYNCREGGDVGKDTEETKIRKSLGMKGIRKSEEHKQKLRECNLGKKYSRDVVEKRAIKLRGKKQSTSHILKNKIIQRNNLYWGIEKHGKKYRIRFIENGIKYRLGKFNTQEDARIKRDEIINGQ